MTGWLFGGIALVFLLAHLGTVGLYLARLRRSPDLPRHIGRPPVTLLRPVCGLDPFDAETLTTSFTQDYPDYEVIFCAQRADDAAVPLVRALIAAHPQIRARLLIGYDAVTGNPKLNNVWKGWQAAQNDWICMTDSNLLLPHDYLSTVVASWGPATGLVSSPPVGIRPEGFAAGLECAFLNGNQARLQFAAGSLGFGFAQGKTLFFNRPLLEHAGGLRALGRRMAEDAMATQATHSLGRVVSLTPLPYAQPIGRRRLAQVWQRQLRWSRVRRDAFPLLFLAEILNGALVPVLCAALAAAALGAGAGPVLVYAALWYLAEMGLARRAGWSGNLGHALLRDLLLPAIWATTFLRRGFEWRGSGVTAPMAETRPAAQAQADLVTP